MSTQTIQSTEKENLEILEIEEIYIDAFKNKKEAYYNRSPDILTYLTYIDSKIDKNTGETVFFRKRLTAIEISVYLAIRNAAGNTHCWKTTKNIAFQANCSTGSVSKAKKTLCQAFEQLDGKPLIEIEERYLFTYEKDKKINKRPNHLVTPINIWNYNNAFNSVLPHIDYQEQYKKGKMTREEAERAIEELSHPQIVHNWRARLQKKQAPGARSQKKQAPGGARSRGEVIHISSNNIPNDNDYESDDLKKIIDSETIPYENLKSETQYISKSEISAYIKSYKRGIVESVLTKLCEKKRKVSNIFSYAKIIADNLQKRERKQHGKNKNKSETKKGSDDSSRRGIYSNGKLDENPLRRFDYGELSKSM